MPLTASDLIVESDFIGQIGRYRCLTELRRGGMGIVCLAEVLPDPNDRLSVSFPELDGIAEEASQQVVLKVSLRNDDHATKRMQQEISSPMCFTTNRSFK